VGGLPELICNGQNGICVPPGDANALSHALAELVNNDPYRLKLGKQAQSFVMNKHNPGRVGQQWLNLLKDVARKKTNHCSDQSENQLAENVALSSRY